jgi:DHA2 family multidrug resistance protein-like MFS transporter
LPLVAVTFVAIWMFAPESRDESKTPLDPVGAVLSLAGLGSLVFAIIQGGEDGWTATSVIAAAGIALVALTAFVQWERHSNHPMLPLTLFRDRRLSLGSGVVTVAFFVMFGFFFLATQYLQFARGYSPLEAGLALLPLPITFVALSPRSAVLAARYGAPRVMATGLVIVGVGFVMLSMLTPGTSYLVLAIAFAVLGAGMGVTAAPATGEIMSAVPLSKAGVGSAVNDTTRELGGALGIAILGSIANTAYRASVDLSGLGLGAAARSQGEESIGTAARVAGTVPGGGVVKARAATAFADAFNVASTVSIVIVVAAAVGVLLFSRTRRGQTNEVPAEEIAEDSGFEFEPVPIGAAQASE